MNAKTKRILMREISECQEKRYGREIPLYYDGMLSGYVSCLQEMGYDVKICPYGAYDIVKRVK